MRANPRLASLLAVQKQRVDRALAAVHERNAMLRQRESERQAALERWEGAVVAYRLERERLTDSIANPGTGIQAARLTGASLRCDLHRDWVTAAAKALGDSDELLAAASAAAMQARSVYRRTLARQDALLTLQASWLKAQGQRVLRLEEQEA
jgi:Tfp pilus tip-associated adhesin PilY1